MPHALAKRGHTALPPLIDKNSSVMPSMVVMNVSRGTSVYRVSESSAGKEAVGSRGFDADGLLLGAPCDPDSRNLDTWRSGKSDIQILGQPDTKEL